MNAQEFIELYQLRRHIQDDLLIKLMAFLPPQPAPIRISVSQLTQKLYCFLATHQKTSPRTPFWTKELLLKEDKQRTKAENDLMWGLSFLIPSYHVSDMETMLRVLYKQFEHLPKYEDNNYRLKRPIFIEGENLDCLKDNIEKIVEWRRRE